MDAGWRLACKALSIFPWTAELIPSDTHRSRELQLVLDPEFL